MADLANRGLESLLARAFEVNKTPEDKRDGIRTLSALRELTDPAAKLSPQQKQALAAKVAGGINAALDKIKDANVLYQQAITLDMNGVAPQLNTLEYWGANPRLMADLRPTAEAVQKIYAKAVERAQAEADEVANKLTGSNVALERKWEELDRLVNTAQMYKDLAAYGLVTAIDPADPKRKAVADEAIKGLEPLDNPDSTVQPVVRNRIAKLTLAKGDFAAAKKLFASMLDPKTEVKPAPDLPQKYEAAYFTAVADLLAGDVAQARKGHADLLAWQKANLPNDKATQQGADAAARMLEYRIASLEAEKASGAAKEQANAKALNVLLGLVKDYPQYKSTVFEQLQDRVPANPQFATLDPLLLQAILQKAEAERLRPENEKADPKALEHGVAAARELINRKGKEGVDAATVENAQILVPLYLTRLGRDVDAANGFLDYAERNPPAAQFAKPSIDQAGNVLAKLQKEDAGRPEVGKLADRFLPLAIDKFGYKELAFQYARRLQAQDKYAQAGKYYEMVPENDPRRLQAQFFRMVTLKQQLDDPQAKLAGAQRQQVMATIDKLANDVNAQAAEKLQATPPAEQGIYRQMAVRTKLLGADLAKREQNDPKKALAYLQGFEQSVAGFPNANDLLAEALFVRVNSYMELGQTNEATKTLVTLLGTKEGGEGARIVYDLLGRLNKDLDAAQARGDTAAMRQIAANRAQLSTFLVKWASEHRDEKIKKFTYNYRVFDAASKKLDAELTEDPNARKEKLTRTLALYKELQSPENLGLYRQTIAGHDKADGGADPQVQFGVAMTAYDLGDFNTAFPILSELINGRKLGAEKTTVSENGESRLVDNDQYWEAKLKQLRAGLKADGVERPSIENDLKRLYVKWGQQAGGKKWGKEFDKLRQEII
ncbi:MAG TPA: hypothetical protein VK324_15710, partial [Tepidisphaeraceae bacterium]|nr:hypothetical protein [Tepidisphaeraceae bacterium]